MVELFRRNRLTTPLTFALLFVALFLSQPVLSDEVLSQKEANEAPPSHTSYGGDDRKPTVYFNKQEQYFSWRAAKMLQDSYGGHSLLQMLNRYEIEEPGIDSLDTLMMKLIAEHHDVTEEALNDMFSHWLIHYHFGLAQIYINIINQYSDENGSNKDIITANSVATVNAYFAEKHATKNVLFSIAWDVKNQLEFDARVSAFEAMVKFRRLNTHPKNPTIGSAFYLYKHGSTVTPLDMEQIKKEFSPENLMSELKSNTDIIVTKSSYKALDNDITLSLDELNAQFSWDLRWLPLELLYSLMEDTNKSADNN